MFYILFVQYILALKKLTKSKYFFKDFTIIPLTKMAITPMFFKQIKNYNYPLLKAQFMVPPEDT